MNAGWEAMKDHVGLSDQRIPCSTRWGRVAHFIREMGFFSKVFETKRNHRIVPLGMDLIAIKPNLRMFVYGIKVCYS